jgi:glutamine synthetase
VLSQEQIARYPEDGFILIEDVPTVCSSLRQTCDALDTDRDFLKKGDVFSDDLIDGYIGLKLEEVKAVETVPHPAEFQLYYNC